MPRVVLTDGLGHYKTVRDESAIPFNPGWVIHRYIQEPGAPEVTQPRKHVKKPTTEGGQQNEENGNG